MGEELLKPTRIYVKAALDLIEKFKIKGIAHITGGGFFENIPRMGNENLRYIIDRGSWPVLPIFNTLMQLGHVEAKDADAVVSYLKEKGEDAYKIGVVSDKLPDDGMTRGTLTVR